MSRGSPGPRRPFSQEVPHGTPEQQALTLSILHPVVPSPHGVPGKDSLPAWDLFSREKEKLFLKGSSQSVGPLPPGLEGTITPRGLEGTVTSPPRAGRDSHLTLPQGWKGLEARTLPLPGLKKVVQGLGQRRGACSEFSPGIPFMCRKVEMRLACTATRLPPTPVERQMPLDVRGVRSGEGRTHPPVPRRRVRH